MSRWLSFAIFIGVALGLIGLWHWYLWLRLVRDPGWSPLVTRLLTIAVVVLAALMPLGLLGSRFLPRWLAEPLAFAAYGWMGLGFLLLVVVAGADVLRLGAAGAERLWAWLVGPNELGGAPADPARRLVVARTLAVAAGAGSVAASLHGLRGALGEVETKEIEVPLSRLPKALDGLTLVQLTDVHVGPLIGRRFVEGIVERTNALSPDVVVITGDLVDGEVDRLLSSVDSLRKLNARYGVYFVTGNHEYYSGVEGWMRALPGLGVRVLDNERVTIGDTGPGGASFDLAGIPDYTAARMRGRAPDLGRAVEGRDPDRELVLLAHQPKAIDEAVRAGTGLVLSGHTHGGQIWPFGMLVALAQPYVAGFHKREDTGIYVSCGTGFWGPPMRVGAPAEITRVALTAG